MGEWRRVELGELVKFENGDRSSNYPKTSDDDPLGVPFVSASDIGDGLIDFSGVRRISSASFERLRAGQFAEGDLLFCLRGTIGKIARVPTAAAGAIASSLVIIRSKNSSLLDYVYYFLRGQEGQAAAIGLNNGSAQPNLSVRLLSKITLPLPPDERIEHIIKILKALDDKIELNRQTSKTLEAMARALFKEWFVDFGPTRAKMEGHTPYLAPDLWSLFPDHIDKEIGLPERWEFSTIGEEVRVIGGTTPSTKEPEFWNGEFNWGNAQRPLETYLARTVRNVPNRHPSRVTKN